MIEEIQLEPIPEHLSNQRAAAGAGNANARSREDNSMLLADDYVDSYPPGSLKPLPAQAKQKANLLSEIAEEDDVSSVSETLKQHAGPHSGSKLHGAFGQAKQSIHSTQNQTSKNDGDSPHMEQKRRSQMVNKQQDKVLIGEEDVAIRNPELKQPQARW